MEGTATLSIATALAFCLAGCADIWQFEELQLTLADAANSETAPTLDATATFDAGVETGAVVAPAPAYGTVDAGADLPEAAAAAETSCGNCTPGVAAMTCPGQKAACNGQCVNVKNDPMNCGGCGIVCPQGGSCQKSVCTMD